MVLVANSCSVISSGTERAAVTDTQRSLMEKARAKPEAAKQVLDKVRAEGIRETRRFVERKLDETIALGYSSAGVVVEVGTNVRGLRPGDRVACAGAGFASHAEVVAVPANLCARVPDGVPLEQAAFSTIASIALHGVRLAEPSLGERVAVIGCGLVGQIACRLLSAAGAHVIAIDLDPAKVALAVSASGARHGFVSDDTATANVLAVTDALGVDICVVTAAAKVNAPLLLAAEVTRPRGSVVLVGDVPIDLPRAPMYTKEIKFRLSCSYGPGRYDPSYELHGIDYPVSYVRWTEQRNMEAVLELLSTGQMDLSDLIELKVPVDKAPDAYAGIAAGEVGNSGAVVLEYGDDSGSELRSQQAAITVSPAADKPAVGKVDAAGPVKAAVLGPGAFASGVLIPALKSAGASLEAVAGGSGPSAANAKSTFGFTRVLGSAEELFGDPEVESVVIATRHSLHAKQAAAALNCGKHVLVEKPLALTVDELEEVLEAANDSDATLTVGFNRRFSPLMRQAGEHLAGEGPMTAVYRVAAGSIPSNNWVHDLEIGGGRLLGEGCHFIDSLRFLVGSPVTEVYATGFGRGDLPLQAADNLIISLKFADGSVGVVIYAADASGKLGKERVEASRAGRSIVLDNFESLQLLDGKQTRLIKAKSVDKGHREEVRLFLEAARGGEPPIPLAQIRNVTLANLAAVRSLAEGQAVRVG